MPSAALVAGTACAGRRAAEHGGAAWVQEQTFRAARATVKLWALAEVNPVNFSQLTCTVTSLRGPLQKSCPRQD